MHDSPALRDLAQRGVPFDIVSHGPVASIEEAANVRGIEVRDLVKTIVVRRAADDYLFVLVPGDREFSWPKMRELLGATRLSMPDAGTAREVTGYERGTITPFGATTAWPVIADKSIVGRRISMGGGAHGLGVFVQADDVIDTLDARVADVVADRP